MNRGKIIIKRVGLNKAENKTNTVQGRNLSRAQQYKLVAQRRTHDEHKQQEATRVDRDRQMVAAVKEEENVDRKRFQRQVQEEQKERAIESAIIQAHTERILRGKQHEQEERLAKELARVNHERQREEKMRQYIRENSIELRELESKLKLAYVSKEQAAQMAEQEAMKLETMREEAEFDSKVQSEREQAAIEEKKLEQKKQEDQLEYQRELSLQLVERERKRQVAYEDFLKEKLMVDEIVRKIYEEDQMQQQLKLERVRATQQHIEEFQRQQAEWRRLEKERMEEENRRIKEFASKQQKSAEDWMAKIREREEAIQHMRDTLAEQIREENRQREEMERIRQELCLEEQEEAYRRQEIEDMERNIRQRLLLQRTCAEQMAMKEMRRQAEKEEEEAFRKMMMDKFAEDDRIEQMNAQRRRMKQLEHKREVQKLIEDRRRQREVDKEMNAKEIAMEQEREAFVRQIIEEERQQLLKRHANKLLGHLPKGLLREDDLKHFDEDFRKNFTIRQAANSANDGGDD
ncbi:meiosis-specific nuclear structural protein 1 [Dunckerocampus dactyliophorus]|uniref:meiosis-specific nuclear structural protein 1 n=1 Tax=Dunckerocampus dactyliophorus TaxID=161453 RepID=UPI0024069BE3|nr:meiosis-specific nuclear structural protein 1 [Dunckerocampus dactyliophorus]